MICLRCGADDRNNALEKRVERGKSQICADCRGRLTNAPKSPLGKCKVHPGDFDWDARMPIDDRGNPILAGVRKCGNDDCIEPTHIIPDYELERVRIRYRTRQPMTLKEEWLALEAERVRKKKSQ